jgi:hypothetical protein
MQRKAGLGVGFLIASACGLALGLLVPPLLPFAVLGILLGLSPVIVRWLAKRRHSWPHVSRKLSIGLAAGAAGLAAVSAVLVLNARNSPNSAVERGHEPDRRGFARHSEAKGRNPFRIDTVALVATYTGEAVQHGGPERLELAERLRMRGSSLALPPGELLTLAHGLRARHWRSSERHAGIVFERHRQVPLEARTFPAETGNTIELPRIAIDDRRDDVTMKVRLGGGSRLLLVASPETFGPSYPRGVRETRPVSGLEQVAIPVGEHEAVEVDVRSPLFRNELLGGFADLTIPGVIRWGLGLLATLLIALFNDEIKEKTKRVLRRLRPRLRAAGG